MTTGARGGFGGVVWRDDGTGTFVKIAEQLDIDGPELLTLLEDATNMDSVEGYAEKIANGIKEVGPITFDCNLLSSNVTHESLRADQASGTLRNWRLVYPPGFGFRLEGAAFVERIGTSLAVRGKATMSIQLTPSGKWAKVPHP